MTNQTIIWTALPNGIEQASATNGQRTLRLSVLVSPRLEPTIIEEQKSRLDLFPDFLNWTKQLQTGSFQVQFGSSLTLPATLLTDGFDTDLWPVLFPPKTYVRPYEFDDFSGVKIISSPSQNLVGLLQEVYTITALEYGVDMLPLGRRQGRPGPEADSGQDSSRSKWDDQLYEPNRPISREARSNLLARAAREMARRTAQLQQDIDRALDLFGIYIPDDPGKSPADLLLFQGFHQSSPVPHKAPVIPDFDFHDIVSLLGDYPELLRRLGLIIDLTIALPADQVVPFDDTIRVVTTWTPELAETTNVFPRTHYHLNVQEPNSAFRTASRPTNPELKDGFLNVQTEAFSVVTVDVDGAIFKLTEAEANLISATKSKLIDTPKAVGIPSLKSGGLSLVHREKPPLFQLDQKTANLLNLSITGTSQDNSGLKPEAAPLYAEDVVRGYRIDVWDSAAQRWFSLCEREGEYRFIDVDGTVVRTLPITEAAIVDTAATEETSGDATLLKLTESLFRWEGWSLAAPRPDQPLASPGEEETPEDPAVPYQLDAQVRAKPGTLPRLRFGHEYRIRVRAVDLTGNGVPFEAQSSETDHATNPVRYSRFEPISSPVLVARSEITDGESLEHLVIRSDFDVDAPTYASQHLPTKYPAMNERHVAPPKIAQLTAETHGKFDYAFGGTDPEEIKKAQMLAYRIARKEKGTFEDKEIINTEDPLSASLTLPAFPETIVVPNTEGGKPHTYTIHRNQTIQLPYLPDPLARGVAFAGLPHAIVGTVSLLEPRKTSSAQDTFTALSRGPGGLLAQRTPNSPSQDNRIDVTVPLPMLIPFDGEWPNTQPFRLQIVEGSQAPNYDPVMRLLTVSLEKAEIRKVRMSCYIEKKGRELLGIWQWIRDNIQQPKTLDESDYGLHGQHWLLTPYRELTLVHAVQRPLELPVLSSVMAKKEGKNGEPTNLGVTIARLTGSIGVHGRSSGKVDLLAHWRESRDVPAEGKPRYRFPDPNQTPGQLSVLIDERVSMQTQVFEVALTYNQKAVELNLQHEFNDTKYRRVSYSAKATSRFREYFLHPSLKEADFSRTGKFVTVDILNSARPQAPRIAQVIPIFRWENSKTETGQVHLRRGNGLRVYLERPWFSSGDGEKLAVIMANRSLTTITDTDKSFFTQWAEDPIYQANAVALMPSTQNFPGKLINHLPLPEYKDGQEPVDVVGYDVHYNAERDQWYSDIPLNVGLPTGVVANIPLSGYFPFVRLSLARYQPKSYDGAHLSTVVLADLAQLAPDRKIVINKAPMAKRTQITVTGSCQSFISKSGLGGIKVTNLMLVHLEQSTAGIGGDLSFVHVNDAFTFTILTGNEMTAPSLFSWSGFVSIPLSSTASTQYRVVVREWEVNRDAPFSFSGNESLDELETNLRKSSRVVFADIITL